MVILLLWCDCAGNATADLRHRSSAGKKVINYSSQNRSTISSGNTGKECEKGFVDLGAIGLLHHDEVGHQFDNWDEDSDDQHPAPGPLRTKRAQEHAGGEYQHRRKKQIADFDVHPSSKQPEQGS